jgi:hypothetical protein
MSRPEARWASIGAVIRAEDRTTSKAPATTNQAGSSSSAKRALLTKPLASPKPTNLMCERLTTWQQHAETKGRC